jgi:hypothetical protein
VLRERMYIRALETEKGAEWDSAPVDWFTDLDVC